MIGGEVIGGIALILGIFTKLAAWLSLPILLGATWMHLGNGWLFSAEGGG
ncbi:DoxX family membrane protein [Litorivicinus sp.]|nr:DoxX family membrane protein [Litorivicinus sp.]